MRLVAMTIGGGAALFVAVFALLEMEPGAEQVSPRQSVAPIQTESPDLRLRLAQEYGTVCQTPQGTVCTVAPQPMNSRCQCGDTFGLIVR